MQMQMQPGVTRAYAQMCSPYAKACKDRRRTCSAAVQRGLHGLALHQRPRVAILAVSSILRVEVLAAARTSQGGPVAVKRAPAWGLWQPVVALRKEVCVALRVLMQQLLRQALRLGPEREARALRRLRGKATCVHGLFRDVHVERRRDQVDVAYRSSLLLFTWCACRVYAQSCAVTHWCQQPPGPPCKCRTDWTGRERL